MVSNRRNTGREDVGRMRCAACGVQRCRERRSAVGVASQTGRGSTVRNLLQSMRAGKQQSSTKAKADGEEPAHMHAATVRQRHDSRGWAARARASKPRARPGRAEERGKELERGRATHVERFSGWLALAAGRDIGNRSILACKHLGGLCVPPTHQTRCHRRAGGERGRCREEGGKRRGREGGGMKERLAPGGNAKWSPGDSIKRL